MCQAIITPIFWRNFNFSWNIYIWTFYICINKKCKKLLFESTILLWLQRVVTASYTYNTEGNIASKTVGSKNKITYQYTASDSIKETNSDGKIEKFFYNSDGRLEKSIDPSGNEITYTYTQQDLVSKEEVKKSGKVVITKEYTYDKNGNVLKSTVTENGKEKRMARIL